MSKIVQAINAMISNPNLISSVIQSGEEFFFLYKGKYKWSILNRNEEFILWFYPGSEPIEDLSQTDGQYWENIPMVKYSAEEIGTTEALNSFSELYTLVKERAFGVNEALDDIISDL